MCVTRAERLYRARVFRSRRRQRDSARHNHTGQIMETRHGHQHRGHISWADPGRPVVWIAGAFDFLAGEAIGKLRGGHEFCDFPDVFRILGPLPAVACAGIKPAPVLHLPMESVYPCRGADSLFVAWQDELDGHGHRHGNDGRLPHRGHRGL